MERTTLKEIKRLAANGAKDITNAEKLPKNLDCGAISRGIYGVNGGIFFDNNNMIYVIIGRSSNLFRLI